MQEKYNEIMRIKEYINQRWTNKNSWKKIPKSTIIIKNTYQ